MKQWIDEGRIGKITGAQVIAGQWLPDWHPWEDFTKSYSARKDLGGGVIFDTHELDYLTWLLGPVQTFVGLNGHSTALPIETEDVAASLLRFRSGAIATLLTDYIQRVSRRSYHISGDQGTIEWDIHGGEVVLHLPKKPRAEVFDAHVEDLNQMYLEQSKTVLEAIRYGRPPVTPVSHMLKILKMQIDWHKQTKVDYPADPGSE
ncbi:MAG: Gfo/Idh/MocA family oxidoreductase [Devosiaceae bacterium]|nr:Gfo/Idh/MocA family oxidoreductase [Devosiaceae bacterium]